MALAGASDEYIAQFKADFAEYIRNADNAITVTAQLGEAFPQAAKQANSMEIALGGVDKAQQNANKSGKTQQTQQSQQLSQLPRLRYALYDVSFAIGIVSAGMVAQGVAVETTAIKYEQLFANVERTSKGLDSIQLGNLRQQLLQITSDIPASFDQVTKIATLGNQLNIPESALASFTKTVAEFSATTNVSVDASATAFGRLGQLLHTTNYKGLGDDIAYLGVNAVATESQIISVGQKIAAASNEAGFGEKQTLALATAVASLGVAPEQARGTFTRAFAQISNAVAAGGTRLNDLAAISGVSAESFKREWGSDASAAFTRFVAGLGTSAGSLQSNLAAVGITAVRDQQTFGLLAQNVGVLTQAQNDATQSTGYLDKAFGVTADTIASKLTVLQNNIARILDTVGSASTGPLSGFIDLLNGAAEALNSVLQDPLAAGGVATASVIITLVGVVGLLSAAFLRVAATGLAFRTASIEAGVESNVFKVALDALTGSLYRNTAAKEANTAATGAATAANRVFVVSTDGTTVAQSTAAASGSKLSGVLGKAGLIGSLLALLPLLPAVGDAISQTASSMAGQRQDADALATSIGNLGSKYDDLARKQLAQQLSGLNPNSGYGPATQTAYTNEQTPSAGSFTDIMGRKGNASLSGAQLYYNKLQTGNSTGRNEVGYLQGGDQLNSNEQDAEARIKAYDEALAKLASSGNQAAVNKGIQEFDNAMKGSGLSDQQLLALLPQTSSALKDTAQGGAAAADGLSQTGDAADGTASAIKDYIDVAFGASNAENQLNADLGKLGEAFVNNSADVASSGSEIQSVIEDIYNVTGGGPQAAAEMQALFNELVSGGLASAQQLSGLQLVIAQLAGNSALPAAAISMDSFTAGMEKATKAAGGQGSRGGGLKKEIRTLIDYANDLGNVFKRSFDIRFGPQQGLDTITGKWQALAKSISSANSDLAKYQAQMEQLNADKATKEYWLTVAKNYGDALRAQQLQADLADTNNQIADTANQLTDAQNANSKTLVGNSEAAIANRSTVLDLVQSYESYLQTLAASGASQATLAVTAQRLRADFVSQATQLGFNSSELSVYASAFDDVSKAINRVPRNITVAANTDPAIQALNELDARAQALSNKSFSGPTFTGAGVDVSTAKAARLAALLGEQAMLVKSLGQTGSSIGPQYANNRLKEISNAINSGSYRVGGYTGDGQPWEVAGLVHRREFVLNERGAQQFPTQALQAANNGASPIPFMLGNGGGSGLPQGGAIRVLAELSPTDRDLLAAGKEVTVVLQGDTLASATQASNTDDNRRGGA